LTPVKLTHKTLISRFPSKRYGGSSLDTVVDLELSQSAL
jgi:hypothetical protein